MATPQGFNIDDAELSAILGQVEQDLAPVLKAEAARLAKSKDEEGSSEEKGPPKDEGSSDESSASAEPSGPPGGDAPPAGDASASAPPGSPPAGPPGADASAAPASPSPAPAGGMPQDPAAIAAMVQGLPPEVLKTVYLAAKQALFAQMSAAPAAPAAPGAPGAAPMDASAAAGAPPAGPPAGPPMDASAGAPPAGPVGSPPVPPEASPALKGELKPSQGNGGKEVPVAKSEDFKAMENLVKNQDAKIELLTKAVGLLTGTPVRKAVTHVSHIAKSEGGAEKKALTKAEVNAKLKEKARDTKLSKSDRNAINRFYDQGANNIDIVAHLLG